MSEPWILACPRCKAALPEDLKCPSCGAAYGRLNGVPQLLPPDLGEDMKMSIEAWNKEWAALEGPVFDARKEEYHRDYLDDTVSQLLAHVDPAKQKRFLEIGCGPAFLSLELAKRGFDVADLDCCVEALRVAGRSFATEGQKSFFIGGDLSHIPLADQSADFLYGGGVIEHFEDTLPALVELRRVLRDGGISFNTVPYISVGTFTYRQIWGNIPDLPVLKPLFVWFHHKLLGGKHCKYGYEYSFTAAKMIKLHKEAGFREVTVLPFKVFLPFHFLPGPLKPLARWLTQFRPFWPMVAVVAKR